MVARANLYNCFTGIHLTKIDVLEGISPLKIAVSYSVSGKKTGLFPIGQKELSNAVPQYIEMNGFDKMGLEQWREAAVKGEKKGLKALPENAEKYARKIEQLLSDGL